MTYAIGPQVASWIDPDWSPTRRRLEVLRRGFDSIYQEAEDRDVRDIPRWNVYNLLRACWIDPTARLTEETIRLADRLFDELIVPKFPPEARSRKLGAKRAFFRLLIHATRLAQYECGCVPWPRGHGNPAWSRVGQRVVDAAIDAELFHPVDSPPGSPKMSRLLPLSALGGTVPYDPVQFDRPTRTTADPAPSYVILRRRDDKADLPFDRTHPVAADVQRRLERINAVNARAAITVGRYGYWDDDIRGERRLRPELVAIFTGDFETHGRLYAQGPYGHQSLRRFLRTTIEFDGEPSVEADFSGLHPRLLYHEAGFDYQDDPYVLWGRDTTAPMRLLAKKVVNAAINAPSREAAVSACNFATMRPDDPATRDAADADRLARALKDSGLTFAAIYDQAVQVHAPIADRFGSDAGMKLMRIDSAIALDVCDRFAGLRVPCLPCHDSFIVPRSLDLELLHVMQEAYRKRIGFDAVITCSRQRAY